MLSLTYRLADQARGNRLGAMLSEARERGDSYRDIRDDLASDGLNVSHETVRRWCIGLGIETERVS